MRCGYGMRLWADVLSTQSTNDPDVVKGINESIALARGTAWGSAYDKYSRGFEWMWGYIKVNAEKELPL